MKAYGIQYRKGNDWHLWFLDVDRRQPFIVCDRHLAEQVVGGTVRIVKVEGH